MNQFIFPLKIYIEDTDYGGIVYHSNYLKFFERARSEWIESLGLTIAWQLEQKILFVIRSVKIDYVKPARLGDRVEVVTKVSHMKKTSLVFEQYLRPAQATDTILCKAEVTVVCLDETFRPRALPQCKLHEFLREM